MIVNLYTDATDMSKYGPRFIGRLCRGWTTKTHMVAGYVLNVCDVIDLSRTSPQLIYSRKLLKCLGRQRDRLSIVMDRAYEADETSQLVLVMRFIPVIQPS